MLQGRKQSRWFNRFVLATILSTALPLAGAGAQGSATASDRNCTYRECALGFAPLWYGIAITRGMSEEQVGVLGFFVPRDVTTIFSGDSDAVDAASNAQSVRIVAAALTDVGAGLVVTGLARAAFQRDMDGLSKALTLGGVAAIGAGLPLQVVADGFLSRAIWLYNRKFAR